jgi:hypothetical protein
MIIAGNRIAQSYMREKSFMKTKCLYSPIRIAHMIQARFQDVFIIKDILLLDDTEELWHLQLTLAGPFEELTKKVIVKKDAYIIWNLLEEGVKWND